jgi:hypothetical protein
MNIVDKQPYNKLIQIISIKLLKVIISFRKRLHFNEFYSYYSNKTNK